VLLFDVIVIGGDGVVGGDIGKSGIGHGNNAGGVFSVAGTYCWWWCW